MPRARDPEDGRGEEAASASALYNTVRTLVTFTFGLALALLVPRWLGPDEYAVYSLLTTFVVYGVALARLSLDTAASRFVAEMSGRGLPVDASGVASTLMRWEAVLCGVVCVALIGGSPLVSTWYGELLGGREQLIVVAAVAVGPEAMGLVLAGVLKGLGRYGYLARLSLWMSPVSFAASVGVMQAGLGVAGLIGVRIVVSASRALLVRRHAGIRWGAGTHTDQMVRRRLSGFVLLWSWLMVVNMVVWERSELYFLGIYWPDHVGFYYLAFSLSMQAMALLPLAVGDVIIPVASRVVGRAGSGALGRVYRSSTRYLVFLALPVAAGGAILAGPIVKLGAGAAYAPAVPLLRVLLISAFLGAVGQGSWAVLTAAERRRFLVTMGMIAAAVNICLDFLLIRRHGASGAVAAKFIAQALPVAVGAVYTCRAFRASFPWASVARSMVAFAPSAASLLIAGQLTRSPVGLLVGLGVAVVLYPSTLLAMRVPCAEDLAAVERVLRFLRPGTKERVLAFVRRHARERSQAGRDA